MNRTDLRAYLRLSRAWLLSITRDRATLFWLVAFPVLFVVIFGLAFGREDGGSYDVGVAVDENTPAGRALLDGMRRVTVFKLHSGSAEAELRELKDGNRYTVVTMGTPVGGGSEAVTVIYDPSRTTSEQIVLPIIRQVVNGVGQALSGRPPALALEERSIRSDTLSFMDFFLPGMIAFSIMQAGMFTAIPLVQLRVTRVLKRFGATPVRRWTILASQGTARLVLGVAQTLVLLLAAKLLFGVTTTTAPLEWLNVLALILVGGIAFLLIGFAVSGFARTEESVPALVQAVSFPMMFLAGTFFPIESFPAFIQPIARVLPLTFLADGLRQAMVGAPPLYPLWLDYLVLTGWFVVAGVIALRAFKWE